MDLNFSSIAPILKFVALNGELFILFLWLLVTAGSFFVLFRSEIFIKLTGILNRWGISLLQLWQKIETGKIYKFLTLLFFINLAIHFLLVLPVSEQLVDFDGYHYMELGRNLARGEGYVSYAFWNAWKSNLGGEILPYPEVFRPPLFPFLISLIYKLFGNDFLFVKLINVILFSLLPLLGFWLAKLITKSEKIGLGLAVVLSLNSFFVDLSFLIYADILFTCLYLLTVIFFLNFIYYPHRPFFLKGQGKLLKNQSSFRFKLSTLLISLATIGFLWGLTYHSRTQALWLLGVPFLVVLIYRYRYKGIGYFAVILLSFLLALVPWLWRTWLATGSALTSDLPWQAWAAYLPRFNETLTVPQVNIVQYLFTHPSVFFQHLVNGLADYVNSLPLALGSIFLLLFLLSLQLWAIESLRPFLIFTIASLATGLLFFASFWAFTRYLAPLYPLIFLLSVVFIFKNSKSQRKETKKSKLVALFCLTLFSFLAIVGWPRQGWLVTLLLILLIVLFLTRLRRSVSSLILSPQALVFILLILFASFIKGVTTGLFPRLEHSFYEHFNAQQYFSDELIIYDYLKKETKLGEAIMTSRRQHQYAYFTNLPVVAFPWCSERCLIDYLKKYNVRFFVQQGSGELKNNKYYNSWPVKQPPKFAKIALDNYFATIWEIDLTQ